MRFSLYLILFLLVLVVLIPRSPAMQPVPSRDAGVFLYMGAQVLDGGVPYRDAWDHKGPLIFYINSLGLLLGNGSNWGVWVLEVSALFLAAVLSWKTLAPIIGERSALFSTAIWLIASNSLLEGGNYTEEFGLLIQFASLYLFICWAKKPEQYQFLFFLGALGGLSFLLRPNNLGIFLVLATIVLLKTWLVHKPQKTEALKQLEEPGTLKTTRVERPGYSEMSENLSEKPGYRMPIKWFQVLGWMLAGIVAVLIPTLLYFFAQGALSDFYDQVVHYNIVYASATWSERAASLVAGLENLGWGMSLVILAAWIGILVTAIRRPRIFNKDYSLLLVALFGLPLELLLASLSGKTLKHYYLTWLPVVALILGGVFSTLGRILSTHRLVGSSMRSSGRFKQPNVVQKISSPTWVNTGVAASLFLILVYPHLVGLHDRWIIKEPEHMKAKYIGEVQRLSAGSEYLLMWGAETRFNFLSGQPSPTRFTYQYPLYTPGYHSAEMVTEFLNDIQKKKPLIIDASALNPAIPPIDPTRREEWQHKSKKYHRGYEVLPEMQSVFAYLEANYRPTSVLEDLNWVVYEYNGP
jgi:hypothetical protein